MQTLLIVIHLMIVCALVGVVLLQKSEGGGLGIGGGGGFMSSRGTANVLTRATAVLAAGFFATSLVLSILAGWHRAPSSILQPSSSSPAPPASGNPATPVAPGGSGGLLDQLRQQEKGPPAPAAPPAGPQAPQSQ
jgi:preprotein translocase subunit SecG